jgi:hypothetical protein
VVRRTQAADARALRRFRCSSGAWYENEAERFIRGPLARRVARGFSAWVVERDGELSAVAAHDGQPHPDRSGAVITWLMVLAARVDNMATPLAVVASLTRLLKAVVADAQSAGRSPYWYALVAADNGTMRRFCERSGFVAGPVPSDPRYLFYTARFDAVSGAVDQGEASGLAGAGGVGGGDAGGGA